METAFLQIGPTRGQHIDVSVPGNPAGPEPKARPPAPLFLII